MNKKMGLMVLGLVVSSVAFADGGKPIAHCFEMSAPLVCTSTDGYELDFHNADCFGGNSVRIVKDGQEIASVEKLAERDLGVRMPKGTGIGPAVPMGLSFEGKNDFSMFVPTTNGRDERNSFQYNVPQGEKIDENNLTCNYR